MRRHLARDGNVIVAGSVRYRTGRGRVIVLSVGKAAFTMARAAERILGTAIDGGLAVGTADPERPLRRIPVRIAGHPQPDSRGAAAAVEAERLVASLGPDDLLLLLLSGGASALLPAPAAGLTLADKAATTAALLRAGADIHELNTVRKHLSRLKGGRLAALAAPARVAALILSDVVGDDLATIASGPVSPDPTTFADALAVVERREALGGKMPSAVRRHLEAGARGGLPETPKPGDPVFARVATRVVGSNGVSVQAAAEEAGRLGLVPLVLTTRLEGEAREAARTLVAVLRECVESGRPARPPVCLLAGGETTVTVRGGGRGGRNQELAAAAAAPLAHFSSPAVVASLATDGVDGHSDAAGGVSDTRSLRRAEALGLPPLEAFLDQSDSRGFLAALGDLILTGPTGTNVVDLVALLAAAPRVPRPTSRGYTEADSQPSRRSRRLVGRATSTRRGRGSASLGAVEKPGSRPPAHGRSSSRG